jgi:DNA-binding response OmpR family regulator
MQETIAIAEDEQDLRELMTEFLATNGYRVIAAADAAEFRAMVEFESVDVAILDINMPGEDGLSLARWLNGRSSTGIIFATAVSSSIDRIVGLESGADDYVTKPYHMREMLARVRGLLRRRKMARAALAGKRLAAIVSIDIVGYTRLIQDDEPEGLALIDGYFRDVVSPTLPKWSGTLFKMLGDGALIDFASVQNAVEWAVDCQRETTSYRQREARAQSLYLRIGVAVGDVIIRNGDRFGEVVALAARIQERAPSGSVLISDVAYAMTRGGVSEKFIAGRFELKSFAEPMQLWLYDASRASPSSLGLSA